MNLMNYYYYFWCYYELVFEFLLTLFELPPKLLWLCIAKFLIISSTSKFDVFYIVVYSLLIGYIW